MIMSIHFIDVSKTDHSHARQSVTVDIQPLFRDAQNGRRGRVQCALKMRLTLSVYIYCLELVTTPYMYVIRFNSVLNISFKPIRCLHIYL